MLKFPKIFESRYSSLIGDYEKFAEICEKPLPKAIRVNILRSNEKQVREILEEEGWTPNKINFLDNAFYVEKREELLGHSLGHFLGYFYIQSLASQLPVAILEPKPHELVLDMAAAPGSKTTQMAQEMDNEGIIVANDINLSRIKALRFNLNKLGVLNTIITRADGRFIHSKKLFFDKILLDAPCSAEGTIRKDWSLLENWSEKLIFSLSRLQEALIESAFRCLKENGTLVYSTCTLAPEENEFVINSLLNKFDNAKVEKVVFDDLKSRECVTSWNGINYSKEVKKCMRLWPQDNNSEGFFIAKVKKV